MYDYMKIQGHDKFFTIQDACEHFGMSKDALRSVCERYGVIFQRFNNTLYYEQCRDGEDDSRIWKEASTKQAKQQKYLGRKSTMLSYIKNIKGLKSTYTLEEVCALLGITADELKNLCDEDDIPVYQDHDGTPIVICYEFLTINNRLCRKRGISEGNACV